VSTRRSFLARAPLGLAALAGCSGEGAAEQLSQAVAAAPPTGAPRPLKAIPSDAAVLNYIPKHDELCYTFGGVAPRHRIKPGTRIVSWTEDCFDGAVKTTRDLASKVMTPGHDNPQTGPFYIEGAEPGDTVAIHVIKVEPARDYAISSYFPGFGALVSSSVLAPDLPETTWVYRLNAERTSARTTSRDGRKSWDVPLRPFLGCLGVAPAANEARSSVVPGPFGGNMDCWEVRAGNTVFLGVNAPGALLSFGDGHYAMGEGEVIGTALEGAMNVEVYVELLKKTATPVPRIENADEVMFVASSRPLDDAARIAFKAMVGWVREKTGMAEMDAYQFVSQAAKSPIVQMVDPEWTVLVKLEKQRLPVSGR
jgi:acetamidase/formamidase